LMISCQAEGRSIQIDVRWAPASSNEDLRRQLAQELIAFQPDLLFRVARLTQPSAATYPCGKICRQRQQPWVAIIAWNSRRIKSRTTKDATQDHPRNHAGCLRHWLRATGDLVAHNSAS
jgi:hypothetical protein